MDANRVGLISAIGVAGVAAVMYIRSATQERVVVDALNIDDANRAEIPRCPLTRDLEDSIETDFSSKMSYGSYLELEKILDAQHPKSDAAGTPIHDEMLFIVQHQTAELWMKLMLHELRAAVTHLKADQLEPCFKILSRVKQIQLQLTSMWSVLETMTPSEYTLFRPFLKSSSGFQSYQYRAIEFMLGNKDKKMLAVHLHDPEVHEMLKKLHEAPSLYDEFLLYLARHGFDVPVESMQRDWTQPYEQNAGVVSVMTTIYKDTKTHWAAYEMCEKLVDIEVNFQVWRYRHMRTVQRIIGFRGGTGGSSGVAFLKKALDLTFFPELFDVRTRLF